MNKMQLGTSDLEVTRICYGCMTIGGDWDLSELKEDACRTAFAALDAAMEAGVNFFDHADLYARGKSEEAFGRWLSQRPGMRERIIIQSKCGIRFPDEPPGTPFRYDFSYEHICRSVENSLKRLRIDCLDSLLLHRPDPLVEPQEVARAFDDLQQAGKVRNFGVSNHSAAQIELLRRYVSQPLVANQIEVSLLHTSMIDAGIDWNVGGSSERVCGDGTLEYCRREDITIQAWSPLARGLLGDAPLNANDPRAALVAQVRAKLAELAAAKGVSSEAIALAWLLRHPAGIQPIIGTRRPEKIKAACQADSVEMSREEWNVLYALARGRRLP